MNSDQQDEADIKLILAYAADATACGATTIGICSPDTDVLVLAICYYSALLKQTFTQKQVRITKQSNSDKSAMQLDQKAAAMAALHGLNGSYNTGSLAGKGKHSFWDAFHAANDSTLAQPSCSVTAHLQQLTSYLCGL